MSVLNSLHSQSLNNSKNNLDIPNDDDDEDEEFFAKKKHRVANGMIDSLLRGMGVAGAVVSSQIRGYSADFDSFQPCQCNYPLVS